MPETVRIALVMNGGVSLAVWMGGVTHEIDLLRRVNADSDDAWGHVLKKAGREVQVDLIAGSSAGGLNGTLLATAIARGASLPHLRDMWRKYARLKAGHLRFPMPLESPNSILDGDNFQASLGKVLSGIHTGDSGGEDVTLLVTSSALEGSSRAVTDASGGKFSAADHRRVYRFRKRKGSKRWNTEFGVIERAELDNFEHTREGVDPLVLAARASAGFPVAFESVQETPALHKLNDVKSDGDPSWLMDGGVLDNAPFEPLLRELIARPRSDSGPRWVVYVVPHNDVDVPPTPADPNPKPPSWTSVLAAVASLSRESDLRSDVESVAERHREAHQTVARPDELLLLNEGIPGLSWDAAFEVAETLLPLYRRTTAKETATNVVLAGSNSMSAQPVPSASVDAVLALDPFWIATDMGATRMMGNEPLWQWGVGRAQPMAAWISRVVRTLDGEQTDTTVAIEVIAGLQEDLLAIDLGMTAVHDEAFKECDQIVGNLAAFNTAVLKTNLLLSLTATMKGMVEQWAAVAALPADECVRRLITVEVLSHFLSWGTPSTPPFDLFILGPRTPEGPWLKPIETKPSLSKLKHWPNQKLYGDRFMNFGAFGSNSFKDWDWMWGRLDGAITLANALLPADLSDEERAMLINPLIDGILVDCGTDRPAVYARCVEVLSTTPSALIAAARDSTETELDGLIDDTAGMLTKHPLVARLTRRRRLAMRGAAWWLSRKAKREARKL